MRSQNLSIRFTFNFTFEHSILKDICVFEHTNNGYPELHFFSLNKSENSKNKYSFFRNKALKDAHEQIDFQTDYVMDLAKEANYGHNLDVAQIFYDWHDDKVS